MILEFGEYSSVVSEALDYVEKYNGRLPDNLAFVSLGTINSGNDGPVPPQYKNEYHYLRGLVHVRYGRVSDAQLELRGIDSTSKYKCELQKWINDADAALKGARGSSVSSTAAPLSIAASVSSSTTKSTVVCQVTPKATTIAISDIAIYDENLAMWGLTGWKLKSIRQKEGYPSGEYYIVLINPKGEEVYAVNGNVDYILNNVYQTKNQIDFLPNQIGDTTFSNM